MNRRVFTRTMGVCLQLVAGVWWLGALTAGTAAETTLKLAQPGSQVVYATIRAGSFAGRNLPTILETRASSNPESCRRALVKFDTEHTIPRGASVASATLTMTVKDASGDPTRRVGAYQTTTSWTETEVTWKNRRDGQPWGKAGGDLGSKLSVATVSNSPGSKATFDVTPLVREAVAGRLGTSRYTRIAQIDLDESTHDSSRSYFTPEASSAAQRPTLTVVLGTGSSTPEPPPVKPPSPPPGNGKTLRVLHWNTHHGGVGTDGVWDPVRLVNEIVPTKADVIS